MKYRLNNTSKRKGALMAAALLLMIISGMFMSAWISLMSSRAIQVSLIQEAVQRRVSVESSRMLSWQCSMDKGFVPAGNMQSNLSGFLGSTLGGINTHDGWTAMNVYSSTRFPTVGSQVFPFNYTGVRPSTSYLFTEQLKRPGSLTGVDDFNSFSFFKSYPPVLGGDLFTFYRKPESTEYNSAQIDLSTNNFSTISWVVNGRTVVRDPPSFFARTTPNPLRIPFQTRSLSIQSFDPYNARGMIGTPIGGTGTLIPSNLPSVPSTSGPVSALSADLFKGFLNVIKNDLNPSNSLWHFMDREKLAGRSDYVTLDVFSKTAVTTGPFWMDEHTGTNKPLYPPFDDKEATPKVLYIQLDHANLTHLRITDPVNQIVLFGQKTPGAYESAGRMSPLMIAIVQNGTSPPLRDIMLVGNNNRRLIVGYKTDLPSDNRGLYLDWRDWPDEGDFSLRNPDWRMVYINEGRFTMVKLPDNVSRNVRWIGGVMTNFTFKRYIPSGSNASRLNFVSDSSVPISGTLLGPAYASLIPRDVWLESYFLPNQPTVSAP